MWFTKNKPATVVIEPQEIAVVEGGDLTERQMSKASISVTRWKKVIATRERTGETEKLAAARVHLEWWERMVVLQSEKVV